MNFVISGVNCIITPPPKKKKLGRVELDSRNGAAFQADVENLRQELESGYDGTGRYGSTKKENKAKEDFIEDQVKHI